MQIGSLVRYHYYDDNSLRGWGVVTSVNRVEPDRPFFFISWVITDHLHGEEINDTWYHPSRLRLICE